jgi:hypothetical protein
MPDPVGALPDAPLDPSRPLGAAFVALGADTFHDAARLVRALPYGRPAGGWRSVLADGRGTCSSKHALLAALAGEACLSVTLVVGLYDMDGGNTPGVGATLARAGFPSLPEAHTFLVAGDALVDLTWPDRLGPPPPTTGDTPMTPEEIETAKPALHRAVLDSWAEARGLDPAVVWRVREACIAAMSGR